MNGFAMVERPEAHLFAPYFFPVLRVLGVVAAGLALGAAGAGADASLRLKYFLAVLPDTGY